jgi:MOSC domain-containing protein YiiM
MQAESGIKTLMHHHARPGRLEWIGLREGHRGRVLPATSVEAIAGRGLAGDHRAARSSRSRREVTLIQAEHLPVIASLVGLDDLDPALLRRNLVVSGINLLTLKGERFRIGEALLQGTGFCHPCSRMEAALGHGGYNALRGHGGLTAIVLEGGLIAVGDPVHTCLPEPA